jgi:ankyrin repeat protein
MSAILIAAKQNYPPVIQEILDASIPKQTLKAILDSEDAAGKTPLYYASLKGFLNIVTLLAPLSDCSYSCRISDSDIRVQPAILAASANGHADIVELLIQNGALVDQTDSHGHTAVSVAAKLGHLNVVKVLVKHGCDLNIRSINQGGTPLQKAKKYKQEHVVEFLNEVMYEERRSSVQSRQDAYSVTKGWIGS